MSILDLLLLTILCREAEGLVREPLDEEDGGGEAGAEGLGLREEAPVGEGAEEVRDALALDADVGREHVVRDGEVRRAHAQPAAVEHARQRAAELAQVHKHRAPRVTSRSSHVQ